MLLSISACVWHLVKLKHAGQLWKSEVTPTMIAIVFLLLSPLTIVITLGLLIHGFITMFDEYGENCG